VLAVTFVCLMTAAAVRSMPGILMRPLEGEFSWDRASIALAVSINLLMFGLAGPFLGRLMDKVGPRRVASGALLLIALGAGLTVFMAKLWQLHLLWGFVVGAGAGGTAMVMGSTVANRWFHQRRGLALGILGAAMSAGQLIFTPTLMQLTVRWGWRAGTLFISAVVGLLVFPLVVVILRDDPIDVGLKPYGVAESPVWDPPARPDSHPMRVAIRSVDFWLLAASFGICGLTTSGLFQTHLIPHGTEHGFSEMTMAVALGVMGATDVLGTIASGWICDRFGKRGPLAFYYFFRGVSLLWLPQVHTEGALMLFAVLYGLNWISTVPATSALTADLFGKQNVGTVFGWIFFSHQVGAAIASYGAGVLRVWLGDYQLAFAIAGIMAILAAMMALRVREGQQELAPVPSV
jgi:MFS family permease